MDLDEINEDTCVDGENEWVAYLKNDVLSTALSYARYAKRMEKLTGSVLKNSLTLSSLANNYF